MTPRLAWLVMTAVLFSCGGGAALVGDGDGEATLQGALGEAPVRLLFVKAASRFDYPGSDGKGRMFGYVEVENLGYAKDVTVHWDDRSGGWRDTPAQYVGPSAGNREVWRFETPEVSYPPRLSADFQFAIRYQVAGREYWDNHGGNDWRVATGARTVFPADLVLGHSRFALQKANAWRFSGSLASLQGVVKVKNLAYDKRIRVVYSTDGWQTVRTADATYGHPVSDDVEEWYFEAPLDAATHVDFALSCEMGGVTTWDNHFGRNYASDVPGFVE